MFKIKFPQNFIKDSKRKRIGWLINLAHSLIKPCVDARYLALKKTNFSSIHHSIVNSFKFVDFKLTSRKLCFDIFIKLNFFEIFILKIMTDHHKELIRKIT